jgi:ABC-type polysaccharide/polyol phosphate transport system ATPase subunit
MLVDEISRPDHPDASRVATRPLAIEVRDLKKSFEIPLERVDSIKERVLHPFAGRETRRLKALDGVSFDVHRGEFFGIVGRNGTGKSTLLKILASIYRAEAGRIRMAGRVAPFIELGVGFNVDLTARENVILNGVMTGLTRNEAEARLDAVIEFAELEEFVDLKLKNYSSGMLVRLAFAVMIQSDAEILLIDEVLAVGDASFQQKCKDVFHGMRESQRTVVLVTHDMAAVEQFCHRAMLLDNGVIGAIGEPEEVAQRYLKLNFERAPAPTADGPDEGPEAIADIVLERAWLENAAGEPTANIELGEQITFRAIFKAVRDVHEPTFGFMVANDDGVDVFGFGSSLTVGEGAEEEVAAGQKIHFSTVIDNRLLAGRYVVKVWVHRDYNFGKLVMHTPHVLDFVAYGTHPPGGFVVIADGSNARVEGGGGAEHGTP